MNLPVSNASGVAARFRPPAVPQIELRGFWGQRADAVAARTADILYDRCVEAGMLDQIDPDRPVPELRIPFHVSDGFTASTVTTQMFWDSDLGKTIETAAYTLYRQKNPALEAKVDAVIDMYAKLQQEDGYLSSWYQRMQPGRRWTNLRDCHELYCCGHLIEGAVDLVPQALVDQLADGGRLVAALGTGRAAKVTVSVKQGGSISGRPAFDAALPPLAAFRRAPAFTF